MKTVMRKAVAIIMCVIYACIGLASFAAESAVFEARPNSQKHVKEASGLYQYGQFMSEEEAEACLSALQDTEIVEYMHDGMLRREEEIYLDEFDEPMYPDQLQTYFTAILNNYPDMYFVSLMYEYYIYDDGTLASLVPIYVMEESDIVETQQLIDAEVEKICAVVDEGMSDFDKITAVHDYFTDNYSYDYENLRDSEYMRKHNMAALFIDKTAVCQGYGLGFQYVMQKLGIECMTVQSPAMSHLWNLVQLENGNWYHVDVTWDDPSQDWYDPVNTPTMSDEEFEFATGNVRTYFMLSDSKIKALDHHSYTPDGMALDDGYGESKMFDVNTAIQWYEGSWYYVDNDGMFRKYNTANDTDEVLFEIKRGWPYMASFSYLYEYNGEIYYNTATDIMKYDPETGTSSMVVESPEGVGGSSYIYKMSLDGNYLTYTVATDYIGANASDKTIDLATLSGNNSEPADVEITSSEIRDGNTVVNISGTTISGVICAVEYDNGKLVSVKILDAAESVIFEGIEADEVYVWKSTASMEPLCKPYIVSN